MQKLVIIGVYLLFSSLLKAQNQQNNSGAVLHSPTGNYLFLEDKNSTLLANSGFTVLRSEKGKNNFLEIGKFSTVKTAPDFEKLVGSGMAQDFKNHIRVNSDEEVIAFLNKPRAVKDFGLFILDINFLRAIGLVYLDPVSKGDPLQFEYKVVSQEGRTLYQQLPKAFDKNSIPKPLVKKIFTTDSIVSVRWEFPSFTSQMPILAKIYRQDDGKGKYREYPQKAAVVQSEGSAYVMHEEAVTPEHLANYFIIPVDLMGNEGYPSDTATAISINFKKIPGIQDIVVKDSMGALFSQWSPLPAKPYYTGIQILRSRDAMKDFVVLDTIAAQATSYLDRRVLPNVTYFYKFRPLVYKLSGYREVIATTVNGSTKASPAPPLAPNNLLAKNEGENIRLSWNYNQELDIFAYYVLRGTSARNMEIVSPAIMDTTWVDSTASLSGRTNYLYAVLAMNFNQLKSEPSSVAGIKPLRKGFVESPSGISLHREGMKVVLAWTDVRKNDAGISGYIVYRKAASDKEFIPVIQQVIPDAYYEDFPSGSPGEFLYTVCAVDQFGNISEQSPVSKIRFDVAKPFPPTQIYVRKLSTGIEVSWPASNNKEIITYTIYRKLADEKNYTKVGSVKPGEGLFIDKNYMVNKLNVYAITVSTENGESEMSVENAIFGSK